MKTFEQLQTETNAVQLGFLLSDLNAAFTFLDIAETTRNGDTRARNVQNATVAYDTIERFRPRVVVTEQQGAELQQQLNLLSRRIQAFKQRRPQDEIAVELK